jgi:hypothetical protein
VDLNIISRQDIRKLLGYWQPKPSGKEIPKDHTLIFSGLRRGFPPLSRELAGQSRPEILLDSELDDEMEDNALTSAASVGTSCFPRLEDDPSSSMIISVHLSRAA